MPPRLKPHKRRPSPVVPFDIHKWHPDLCKTLDCHHRRPPKTPSDLFFVTAKTLSPIARFISDSLQKHRFWSPSVISDLEKLRRVTPDVVAEVLKVQSDPKISTQFFHWAGKQKGFRHNFAGYNALAYCLNRNKQFRAADRLPEMMRSHGKPPGEKQFEILIRMHVDANRGLRLYHTYEKMKKFGVKPRVFLYNRVMDGLLKTNHLDLAISVYQDFKGNGLVEDSVTFMLLIKGLCKSGRTDEALRLLHQMRCNLCKPDVFAYTAMVKSLVSGGFMDGALRVWCEMEKDGVKPDVMAYATMVRGLCEGKQTGKAYGFFKEMKEKGHIVDRDVYFLLIKSFVGDGDVGFACDLLKEFISSGYRPDLCMYNCVIEGLSAIEEVERARRLFHVAIGDSLEPDFHTTRPILACFARLGRTEEFCRFLLEMEEMGFTVSEEMGKLLAFMVEAEAMVATAFTIFEVLKRKGYCQISYYNILMGVSWKNGDIQRALSLFDEAKERGLSPDSSTYSIAIMCFASVGRLAEARHCYNKMKETGGTPSAEAYQSFVKGLCRGGEIEEAVVVLRECLRSVESGPVEFKYVLTIIDACRKGGWEKVMEVVGEMREERYPVDDDIVLCGVIFGMGRYGSPEAARRVFAGMRELGDISHGRMAECSEMLVDHMEKITARLVESGLKLLGLDENLRSTELKGL